MSWASSVLLSAGVCPSPSAGATVADSFEPFLGTKCRASNVLNNFVPSFCFDSCLGLEKSACYSVKSSAFATGVVSAGSCWIRCCPPLPQQRTSPLGSIDELHNKGSVASSTSRTSLLLSTLVMRAHQLAIDFDFTGAAAAAQAAGGDAHPRRLGRLQPAAASGSGAAASIGPAQANRAHECS